MVVRERTYGATGVDLTPYGIGTGSDDFVQSVYFRLYPQSGPGEKTRFVGTVTFPAGIRILGFITSGTWLGSSSPGSPYTQSDALFAVSANPDDYATPGRGFDPGSGDGALEFLCQINEQSFLFGLDVSGGGTDDFRVIIDYGTDFPPALTFEVNLSTEMLGSVNASQGIRLGGTAGTSPGEGDYGEITHLLGTPLTTDIPPVASTTPPVAGNGVIYLVREAPGEPIIDALDAAARASIPDMIHLPPLFNQPPRAIAFAEDGLLYTVGNQTGLAAVDTATGDVTNIGVPDLPGLIQRMAVLKGDSRLFILRHTDFPAPEDAWIDTYDTATGIFTPQLATFPTNVLPFPVDLIGTPGGRLYALGSRGFHEIDPFTGEVRPQVYLLPLLPGDYVRGTADPRSSLVYLLRDSPGDTFVDSLDILTGDFHAAVFTLPSTTIPDLGAVIVDNGGLLWVFGKNGGTMGFDPSAPAVPPFYQTQCLDFAGTTNYAAVQISPREVSAPSSPRQLDLVKSPQAGQLRLTFEDLADPTLAYNVYAGTLGSYYSHAPLVCHDPGTPGPPGYLYMDLPLPGDSTYYFVTVSNTVSEGPSGHTRVAAGTPGCGPVP